MSGYTRDEYRFTDPDYVDDYGCKCPPPVGDDYPCDCKCELESGATTCDCHWLSLMGDPAQWRTAPPEARAIMRDWAARCVCGLGDWKDDGEKCGGGLSYWVGDDQCSCRDGDPYYDSKEKREGDTGDGGEWMIPPPVLGDCPCRNRPAWAFAEPFTSPASSISTAELGDVGDLGGGVGGSVGDVGPVGDLPSSGVGDLPSGSSGVGGVGDSSAPAWPPAPGQEWAQVLGLVARGGRIL